MATKKLKSSQTLTSSSSLKNSKELSVKFRARWSSPRMLKLMLAAETHSEAKMKSNKKEAVVPKINTSQKLTILLTVSVIKFMPSPKMTTRTTILKIILRPLLQKFLKIGKPISRLESKLLLSSYSASSMTSQFIPLRTTQLKELWFTPSTRMKKMRLPSFTTSSKDSPTSKFDHQHVYSFKSSLSNIKILDAIIKYQYSLIQEDWKD